MLNDDELDILKSTTSLLGLSDFENKDEKAFKHLMKLETQLFECDSCNLEDDIKDQMQDPFDSPEKK